MATVAIDTKRFLISFLKLLAIFATFVGIGICVDLLILLDSELVGLGTIYGILFAGISIVCLQEKIFGENII